MFMWKALTDSLPTRKNLLKRRIIVNSSCPICESEEESIGHAIRNCVSASDVWNEIESPVQKWGCSEKDLFVVWAKMVEILSQEQLELVATVMRKIWLRMNQFVFENAFTDPKFLFKQAVDSLAEFQLAQAAEGKGQCSRSSAVGRNLCRWQKPAPNTVKANWDAALKDKEGKMGM
ncbi:uncharacterized protein LOC122274550 [Carya illinoinensis]|uniref:uncharacterized protein LOC122274550 n=1 Tax=Carya illinoinensis TaxID=32201 RepID=UPI001C721EAB|nr:uncharacterized protein LOC122274550 [Carya illinoinensis]